MTLLETWRETAYNAQTDKKTMKEFWDVYFEKEKAIYKQLLADPDTEVKGTVKELAEKYGIDIQTMTGFLDGITGVYQTPKGYYVDDADVEAFDRSFPPREKLKLPGQLF